mmetsp:Transcript_40769/g.89109  ORF Transcript_40769/g.89109 Transcript_40769/m.89109 type:complete len:163 (+) Transcript_40769:64-552(+)
MSAAVAALCEANFPEIQRDLPFELKGGGRARRGRQGRDPLEGWTVCDLTGPALQEKEDEDWTLCGSPSGSSDTFDEASAVTEAEEAPGSRKQSYADVVASSSAAAREDRSRSAESKRPGPNSCRGLPSKLRDRARTNEADADEQGASVQNNSTRHRRSPGEC